tara:strand:+ start:32 stop:145 length:114 start_codon:yes stop_codon:yes gene_type:complete
MILIIGSSHANVDLRIAAVILLEQKVVGESIKNSKRT